jgi:hypothetical protein
MKTARPHLGYAEFCIGVLSGIGADVNRKPCRMKRKVVDE